MATVNGSVEGASILFINNFPGPGIGGGEVQLLVLLRATLDAGMRVSVVAQPGSGLAEKAHHAGAEVFEVDMTPTRTVSAVSRIRDLIATTEADIVQGTGFLTNALARLAARESAARVAAAVHALPSAWRLERPSLAASLARFALERAARDRVDCIVAVSAAVTAALIERGCDPQRIREIPNGVDVVALREAAAGPLPPGVPPGEAPLVVVAARLTPVKGVEHFVRAAAIVTQRGPGVRFAVAGAGPEERRLRTLADASVLGERMRFLGYMPSAAPLLAHADVVVVPSLSESFSLVALEAMALGKPVVATAVGGLPEVVADGVTGHLVPAADPSELADSIIALTTDTACAGKMGVAGQDRAESRFTLGRMTDAYLRLYADLLSG